MLSDDQRARYDRHLRLASFGEEAQERLLAGSVLIIGAGGLGSPALLYLAAAGVGRIGIVDDDVVDRSNLQRQVVHRDCDVGTAKAVSAARAVTERNPGVAVDVHEVRLHENNVRDLLQGYDVVIDGSDNFTTRYLVNDAAVLTGVPVVHGSIQQFDGQVSVFAADNGPCYRCLFPDPPPRGTVPSCSQAGVLGVLPGTIGSVQATEAIKLLTGLGEPLIGRLLRYDALRMTWSELRLPRDPDCPVCGEQRTITDVTQVEDVVCNVPALLRLSAQDYDRMRARGEDHLLLDVREHSEVAAGHIPGHKHVPLGELRDRMAELEGWRDRLIVCQCHRGGRSLEAAEVLSELGFTRLANLEGGYLDWRRWTQEGVSTGL